MYLWKRRHKVRSPLGVPHASWCNAVLRTRTESDGAVEQVRRLGLPVMQDLPKNWDSLAALDLLLRRTDRSARILDAGSEQYSMILPWLAMYGYRHLVGCNLVFEAPRRLGPIRYEYGDVTALRYPDNSFDAVTCLSVVEHGVDLEAFFQEMARVLRPGGLLITSTDYFETPVDTHGQQAYGVPIHIFTAAEIEQALDLAANHGFALLSPVDLRSEEKVVTWPRFGLAYTFVIVSMSLAKSH